MTEQEKPMPWCERCQAYHHESAQCITRKDSALLDCQKCPAIMPGHAAVLDETGMLIWAGPIRERSFLGDGRRRVLLNPVDWESLNSFVQKRRH